MIFKTLFDYLLALILIPILLPVILLLVLISTLDTGSFGLFSQTRVGKNARNFQIYKIRTMKGRHQLNVTTQKTHKITSIGRFLRHSKLDEIPQIFNILLGQMSFVGPRPDVPGYADQLQGEDRIILKVKPGITGPAQIEFKDEEELLAAQKNPLQFNDEVIWPKKIKINKDYVQNQSFWSDLNYIFKTLF